MSDVNFRSFVGPDDDGKTVELGDVVLPTGTKWASAIKISGGVTGLTVQAGVVEGGRDACVDINNRANDVFVDVAGARPSGQFVQTCKGGAFGVHSRFTDIVGHGSVCDFLYDDYSDQAHDSTQDCSLFANHKDGSPVYVIALKATPTLLGGGPYRFPWWHRLNFRVPFTVNYYLVGFAFDTLRRWGFFRSASNAGT